MARRRFFVDEVRSGRAHIEGSDAHHLSRVLRVESGQKYEISDNQNIYLAEIEAARKDLVTFSILERLTPEEPLVRVSLYASLIRFERFESLLEKATEFGVERVVPVAAERSESGLDRAAIKRSSRWERIAREASEQSRRDRLPKIERVETLWRAIDCPIALRFVLEERPGAEPLLNALDSVRRRGAEVAVLVGPEGGWSDREREAAAERGWRAVSLGRTILKTETAALAAVAIVNAAWDAGS